MLILSYFLLEERDTRGEDVRFILYENRPIPVICCRDRTWLMMINDDNEYTVKQVPKFIVHKSSHIMFSLITQKPNAC